VHDCVLAEEDDLARGADEPLAVPGRLGRGVLVERKLLDCTADRLHWRELGANVRARLERDRAGVKKRTLEVVEQVARGSSVNMIIPWRAGKQNTLTVECGSQAESRLETKRVLAKRRACKGRRI
jgi:hypothetical protein